MSDETDDLDLGLDDLPSQAEATTPKKKAKKGAKALERTAAQQAQASIVAARMAANQQAAKLAQIVNLHIGGYSLAQIGAAIGASESEVDRMLQNETARYVKNQPALRTYVRNYISEKYKGLLDATYAQATDKTNKQQLEYQDRSLRVLKEMARLHGAEAPTQSEVKVEATPEAVDALVQKLAAGEGLGYDTDIFDVEYVEEVHEAAEQAHEATVVSGNAVSEPQEGEPDDGF